jgi:hypothetical protein
MHLCLRGADLWRGRSRFWDAQRVSDGLRYRDIVPETVVAEKNENEMRLVLRNAQGACTRAAVAKDAEEQLSVTALPQTTTCTF